MTARCASLAFLVLWSCVRHCACLQPHHASSIAIPDDNAQLPVTSSFWDDASASYVFPCTKSVWWLHIPKTGTTFGLSAHACVKCEDVPRHSYHTPVKSDASPEFVAKVVGMFRQPEQRLASELGHIKKTIARTTQDLAVIDDEISPGLWGLGHYMLPLKANLSKGFTPANNNFMGQAMQGCQTKMLNGDSCFSETPSNDTHVEMAIQKVNSMLFVGLQEEWLLSICLFNRIVTGKRFTEPWQLKNTRPTSGDKSTEYDTSGYPKDKYDHAVYAAAKARFSSDLDKYDITEESCAQTYSGEPLEEASEAFARTNEVGEGQIRACLP